MAALEMLKLNGYVYEAPDDESTAETIISAIAGHITEQDLIDRLTPYVSPS